MQNFHSMVKRMCFVLVTVFFSIVAQTQPSAISLFASDTVPQVILTTDMRTFMKSKYTEQEQPARLQIVHGIGDTSTYAVEVRCRGNIRKEVCYFPSLRMKLPKKDFTYNKLKWVNVCDSDEDRNYLLKEYLAYKMYKLITDKSFETYLVRMTYVDAEGKNKPFESYAFVIQNADELAAQFGGRVHEPTVLKETILHPEQLAVFAFFQYMIGNTDWAFGNRHNVEVFTDPASNAVIPVAYDFDYSGLVNTKYAVPHESMPIQHVTVRHNKCACIDETLCEKTRLLYLEKKEAILSCFQDCTLLDRKVKARAVDYLEDFFKLIEDPKTVQRIFVEECRSAR